MNEKADKAAIFAGWRDMNDYMRENKIDPVPPQLNAQGVSSKPGEGEAAQEDAPPARPVRPAKAH